LCSDSPAWLAAQEGRWYTAARLMGYADAAYRSRTLLRHPLEAGARVRTEHLAREALGDAEFDRLVREGQTLRDAEVEALAFGTGDDPVVPGR